MATTTKVKKKVLSCNANWLITLLWESLDRSEDFLLHDFSGVTILEM